MRVLTLQAGAAHCAQAAKRAPAAPQTTSFVSVLSHLGARIAAEAPEPSPARRSPIARAAAAPTEAGTAAAPAAPAGPHPTAAETARTIVDLVAHGTLCTLGEDGIPLGTYVSYVLDQEGQPILRLRADAVHTANLGRDGQCSLFVQPGEHPARLLARVTLIGKVEPVTPEVAATAAELHGTLHAGGVGVDAPAPSDLYCRLVVDRCFYVGQLSGECAAEVVTGAEYRAAQADPLRTQASGLAGAMNEGRMEDVMRIAAAALGTPFEDLYYAELLWVDRLGAYIKAVAQDGASRGVRVQFAREVDDVRGVQSALTMMAQTSWEAERPYNPVSAMVSVDSS